MKFDEWYKSKVITRNDFPFEALVEKEALRACFNEARSMNWISVNDKLPEEDVYVLAYSEELGAAVAMYMDDGDGNSYWNVRFYSEVLITHWMPLPEPPRK